MSTVDSAEEHVAVRNGRDEIARAARIDISARMEIHVACLRDALERVFWQARVDLDTRLHAFEVLGVWNLIWVVVDLARGRGRGRGRDPCVLRENFTLLEK